MPTEVLTQLRTLRESVADSLRKDPRFLTLSALDKSIAEISGVLTNSGLLTEPPAPLSAFHFDTPLPAAPASVPPATTPQSSHDLSAAAVLALDAEPSASRSPAKLGRSAPATGEGPPPHGDPEGEAGGPAPAVAAAGAFGEVMPEGKASGYTPMAAKPDATQYQPALSVKFGKLPNKVDLRPLMTPIEDQGDTMSCVANAVAGAYEYWIKKATKQDTNISRLFVYYNARWRDGSQDKDEGSVIQLAMDGLAKFGACAEHVWPFDKRLVIEKPGADAYQDGAAWKVQDMAQVPMTLEAWKQALAEGRPIVFGIALFDTFDTCAERGGVVEMPSPEDVARASHSGHAMCAVGYSDTEKVFIVRNSWGPDWGDRGYCYMPYAYLLNPKFNDGDNWVFVPKVPMQPPREVWSDDTAPVTNDGHGVDFAIERFKVEDYAHVAFDFFERARKPFNTFVGQDFSDQVALARQNLWQSMESFDYRSFLASTAAAPGAATLVETSGEHEHGEDASFEEDDGSDAHQREDAAADDGSEHHAPDDVGGDHGHGNTEDDRDRLHERPQ